MVSAASVAVLLLLGAAAGREPDPSLKAVEANNDYRAAADAKEKMYADAKKTMDKAPGSRQVLMKRVMEAQAAAVKASQEAADKAKAVAEALSEKMDSDASVDAADEVVAETDDRTPDAEELKLYVGSPDGGVGPGEEDCKCAKQLFGLLQRKKKVATFDAAGRPCGCQKAATGRRGDRRFRR